MRLSAWTTGPDMPLCAEDGELKERSQADTLGSACRELTGKPAGWLWGPIKELMIFHRWSTERVQVIEKGPAFLKPGHSSSP